MNPAPLLMHLFGPPEFRVNGELLPRLKTRKGLYILALLALRHGREVERNWLAGILWPENDEETARTYLRQSLTDLRNALGSESGRLLSPTQRTLRLDIESGATADVDVATFAQCLKRSDTASLEQVVALYRGPLLEGWTEEWLLSEREAYTQAYLGALETLTRQSREAGDHASAIRYLRLLVAADPLRESASRVLMQTLASTHDYGALTQVYRDLRTVLRREVNAEPDAETQALFARLRTEARRQAGDTSPLPKATTSRPNVAPATERAASRSVTLPRPLSEFIGRTREVDTLKRTLMTSRLVTLTGIGGVGKTRLSIRVAEEVSDDFPDGVRFVDLSPVADPTLVAKTVATTLGVTESAGRPLTETLSDYLQERHLLLVLDNCEQVSDACARLAAALLSTCSHVRILATSRQRLGITGETVRRVPPLTLPERNPLLDEEKNAVGSLLEYEAVRLFVDRAQRVQPDLSLTPSTLRAIAVLCRRLDGIPLALELAAARMSVLGPEQIMVRLTERFRLLSGGDRTAPARQRTLRGALDWSYDLLLPEERVLLSRLSVFAGGCTLEAAEAVCAAPAAEGYCGLDEWEVMDCLTGLVNHSLILMESESGEVRYRLLETVREYAQERLHERAVGEPTWLRAKHREYFELLVQNALPHLGGLEQSVWLDRLEREHDNLRATLDGCLEEGTAEAIRAGLQLAGELQRFWMQRGHASEGRRRYAALLSADHSEPSPERGRALESAGILAFRQADYMAAREVLEEALTVHRRTGNRLSEATPLGVLGNIAYLQGNYGEARSLLEQALALRREAGHRPGEAVILNSLGNVAAEQEDFASAQMLYTQALAISQEVGDRAIEASILNGLGLLADAENDLKSAHRWFEKALMIGRELGDYSQMTIHTFNLGNNAYLLGDRVAAADYFRQALLLTRELGESRSRRVIAFLLMGTALTTRVHQPERTARLLGASNAQREAIGIRLNAKEQVECDQLLADLHHALGEERLSAFQAEGRVMRIDQAVAIALEQ